MTETTDRLDKFKKDFDLLADELRDFDRRAFDRLRDDYFFMLRDRAFKYHCRKNLIEGKSPARKWLEVNGYPIDAIEVTILKFIRCLTDKSKKEFSIVLERYVFMQSNSAAFCKKCEDQTKMGLNPFMIWMKKQAFDPAFKQENTEGAKSG